MPKLPLTKRDKTAKYRDLYKGEFTITLNDDLCCNLCNYVVDSSRKSTVDKHRNRIKHKEELNNRNIITT